MRRYVVFVAMAVLVGCSSGTTTSPTTSVTVTAATPTAENPAASVAAESAAASAAAASPSASAAAASPAASVAAESPAAAAFAPISLKGTGNKVAKFEIPEGSPAIADMTHKGKENFIVHPVDASGEKGITLVNEIGTYQGTVLFDKREREHTVAFAIDADGAWTITIKPLTDAKTWDPTTTLNGVGDSVYQVVPPPTGLVTVDLTYDGKENFIVYAYTPDDRENLANEIGKFSGQVLLPVGTILLEVTANDAKWSAVPG